jgi:cytochrome P450
VRLPVMVIADQLGIPRKDLAVFKQWSDAAIEQIDPLLSAQRELELTRLIIDMQSYFVARAEQLRRQPADNLFSDLVHAEIEGRRLDDREMCSIVQQLLVAGNETTTSTLGSALILLIETPGLADTLHERTELVRAFVEEVLRLRSPVQGLLRRARADIDVDGVTIPKGAIVHLMNAAANHDPRIFANPHEIDLFRDNGARHMAFGHGIHFCIGAQLARAELNVAITEMVGRLKNFRYVDGQNSVDHLATYTYAPSKIHFAFDKR